MKLLSGPSHGRVAQLCFCTAAATLVVFFGCRTWIGVPTLDTVRAQNRERLSQLSPGMPKAKVLELMGTETVQTYTRSALPSRRGSRAISDEIKARYRGERVNNPYRIEASHTADGTLVEVLFYYTDQQRSTRRITNHDLTPLAIEGGVLTGWGWIHLDQNIERYGIELSQP
jgi:hypothetical protein